MSRTPRSGLITFLFLSLSAHILPSPAGSEELHRPLRGTHLLAASFGEYRPTHLHPGIDFSTAGRIGLPVHAVAAGDIYRLKVQWRGYGRALYLRHANGYVSVYAHLDRYENETLGLERRVARAKRTRGVRYPGDIFLDPPVPVSAGQLIGYSGESGAGLPHLHFELRRGEGRPTEPLLKSWFSEDNLASPLFSSLLLKADEPDSWISSSREFEVPFERDENGVYVPSQRIEFTGSFIPLATVHSQDEEGHRLGIGGLTVHLDGRPVYRFRMRSFGFEDYPKVGLLLDHAHSGLAPTRYAYCLRRLPGNDLGASGPEHPWPGLGPGEHLLEVEASGPLGRTARARVPFTVRPRIAPVWSSLPSSPAGSVFRLSYPREEWEGSLQTRYTLLGTGTALACLDRVEFPDGESCRFQLPAGSKGITAQLLGDGANLGRASLFLPDVGGAHPLLPAVKVRPSRHFVDLWIPMREAEPPPARIRLEGDGSLIRPLTEMRPGRLVATVSREEWGMPDRVVLEWADGFSAPHPTLAKEVLVAGPTTSSELVGCGSRLLLPPQALFAPAVVACERVDEPLPAEEGMLILGAPVRLLPEGLPLARRAHVRLDPPAPRIHPERIGVYRLDPIRARWLYLGGEQEDDSFSVQVDRFEVLGLLRDDAPPQILEVTPAESNHPGLHLRIRVEEVGSGLNYDGVRVELDGVPLESEFDPDRGWSVAVSDRPWSPGVHTGRAWAEDRAGNRSEVVPFHITVP